jgi:hypothetical protein
MLNCNDMASDLFARYNFTGVHPVVLYGMGILCALLTIGEFLITGSSSVIIFMTLIPWCLCAPYCMRWARLGKLSVTWAFAIGVFFGLLGLAAYWVYFKAKGGDKGGTSNW